MSNGEMISELRLLLQEKEIETETAQRMTLSAVADILEDTRELTGRIDVVTERITCLQDANENILVVVEQHSRILELWSTNPGRNFVAWCGKHVKFMLIILTMIVVILAVDVIRGGYWSEILAGMDGWMKYLKMVL